ncbi:MAG: acyltransferase family protein, partial [Thermoflexus sp.]
ATGFRYLGWLGYQGTGVFLVLSGFGLTWALASRSREAEIDRRAFYLRRFLRLFPLYWVGHFFFLGFNHLAGWRPFSALDPRFALSLLGIRFLPEVFHFISPAWWFIVLIMQLYAVFPFLWKALQRTGLLRFWIGMALLTAASRWVGFFLLPVDREMWSRGLLFTSRLAEFALGMGIAWWAAGDVRRIEDLLRTPRAWAGLLALYALGLSLSFTLPGAVVAPMLITPAAAGFLLLLARDLMPRLRSLHQALSTLGIYSYGVMVFHQPILWAFITWLWPFSMPLTLRLGAIGLVTALIFIGSAALERGTNLLLRKRPLSWIFPQPGPYALPPAHVRHPVG